MLPTTFASPFNISDIRVGLTVMSIMVSEVAPVFYLSDKLKKRGSETDGILDLMKYRIIPVL